jgi:hypothetical protein
MTLFLLSPWCVGREFIYGVDSIWYLSLSIHWPFQGLRLLCFGRRFMDQPWHSIFDNSMHQPWLYFCFRFDASVVNSLTMSIPWGICHSVFIDDFKVYGYSVLAADLWISCDIAFLTIPWVGHDSIFSIDLMRRSWIYWRYRFHAVAVTQYSLTISRSTVTLFGRRFMEQPWDSVFDNSMSRTWLYFCNRFDASFVNSVTLSIPLGSCHSVFIDDFKVYCYSLLAGDLWISRDRVFYSFPCVGHDFIFSIDLMRRSWIHWCCRFLAVALTQYSLTNSRSIVTLFWLVIYGLAVTECFFHFHASAMTLFLLSTWCFRREFIDVVGSMLYLSLSIHWRFQGLRLLCFGRRFMDQPWHSIFYNSMRRPWLYFSIDLMRWSWIHWRCRCHAKAVTQYSLMIWRSTVTLFWPVIYGSAVT